MKMIVSFLPPLLMVDIVVITNDSLSSLKQCLRSVSLYTKNIPYRLIIVNNGSSDGTKKYLKELDPQTCAVLNLPKNLGFSCAANWVTKKLKSPYVLFLDDHVRVSKDWLAELVDSAKGKNKVAIVGCKIVSTVHRIISCEMRLSPQRALFAKEFDGGQADYVKEVDLLEGKCFLIKRSLFDAVGGFDEENFFSRQGEDWDYCLRVRKAGYKIIYNGGVKIVYDDLAVSDIKKDLKPNRNRYHEKWDDLLAKEFPRSDSHMADHLMSQAIKALRLGDNCKALDLSRKLKFLHPELVESWVPALANVRLKNYDEAIESLHDLVKKNPDNYSARNYLTLCLRQLGEKKAGEDYTNRMFTCISRNIKVKREAKRSHVE